jgi:hypothetical protein
MWTGQNPMTGWKPAKEKGRAVGRTAGPVPNPPEHPCTRRAEDYARRMSVEHAINHTRKPHNAKRAKVDGVRFFKRDGQVAYLEYCAPFGVLYTPALNGGLEQIQCRAGDSTVTIEGRHLWLLLEDLQTRLCEEVRESDLHQAQIPGVMHIETITVRLWL